MRAFLRGTLAGVLSLAVTGAAPPAAAQGGAGASSPAVCGYEQQIIDLSADILELRSELPPTVARRFGADAAYLALRYGILSTEEGLVFLDTIAAGGQRAPQALDDLLGAFAVSQLGIEAGLAAAGDDPLRAFAERGWSVGRAVMLADRGASFFRLLAQARDTPELQRLIGIQYFPGRAAAILLLGQPDEIRREAAVHAERTGALADAAAILATRADPADYFALIERNGADEVLLRHAGGRQLDASGLTAAEHDRPLEDLAPLDEPVRRARRQIFDIVRAAYFGRGADFLMTVVNQTGRLDEVSAAARLYLTAVRKGVITPHSSVEDAWLMTYRALVAEMGRAEAHQVLATFELQRRIRHFAGRAQKTLDWALAKQALGPYLSGAWPEPPERPDILSDGFDWTAWSDLARALRRGGPAALADIDHDAAVAVELLYVAGEISAAVDAAGELDLRKRLPALRDLMLRLDQRCGAYSDYPGQALLLPGRVIYRFPAAAP